MHVTKRIDLPLLERELAAAGVPDVRGLVLTGTDDDAELLTMAAPDGDNVSQPTDLDPAAEPVVARHDASAPGRATAFEAQEDQERLALVAERSQADPAFAALAELALGK